VYTLILLRVFEWDLSLFFAEVSSVLCKQVCLSL